MSLECLVTAKKRGFRLLKEHLEGFRRRIRDLDDSLPVKSAKEHFSERVRRRGHHCGMGGKANLLLNVVLSLYIGLARRTKHLFFFDA